MFIYVLGDTNMCENIISECQLDDLSHHIADYLGRYGINIECDLTELNEALQKTFDEDLGIKVAEEVNFSDLKGEQWTAWFELTREAQVLRGDAFNAITSEDTDEEAKRHFEEFDGDIVLAKTKLLTKGQFISRSGVNENEQVDTEQNGTLQTAGKYACTISVNMNINDETQTEQAILDNLREWTKPIVENGGTVDVCIGMPEAVADDVEHGYVITDEDDGWQRCLVVNETTFIYKCTRNGQAYEIEIDVDDIDHSEALSGFYDEETAKGELGDSYNQIVAECYFENELA